MGQCCWSQKEALLTNCCHETIYQTNASPMSLTHCQLHQILPLRIWWQLTHVSLNCLLAIWRANLVFLWRHWSVTYLLMNVLQVFIILYKGHLHPCPPIGILYFLCQCAAWKKLHTQKCGNFEKIMRMTSSHVKSLYFRTCLNSIKFQC